MQLFVITLSLKHMMTSQNSQPTKHLRRIQGKTIRVCNK